MHAHVSLCAGATLHGGQRVTCDTQFSSSSVGSGDEVSSLDANLLLAESSCWPLFLMLALGILFRTTGPFILVVLFAGFFLNNAFIVLALVGIGFFLWYPWATLALARSAAEVLGKGPRDPWWART